MRWGNNILTLDTILFTNMLCTLVIFVTVLIVKNYAIKDLFDLNTCSGESEIVKRCKEENLDFVLNYLNEFGYLNISNSTDISNINLTLVSDAILLFQEYYNLTINGKITNENLQFMRIPRCGLKDTIYPFRLSSEKWHKKVLKWYFVVATRQVKELAKQAFKIWEKHTDLVFVNDRSNVDILISYKKGVHKLQRSSIFCTNTFDGEGGVLAHAFHPNVNQSTREIHIDSDELWCLERDILKCDQGKIFLLSVLIHEIGHTLGISHSNDPTSVMYPYYQNMNDELSADDILAIQTLYGPKDTISTTTRPSKSATERVKQDKEDSPNLCDLKNLKTFLVINHQLYIFYEKWFWSVNLQDKTVVNKAQLIVDWLIFLPENFTKFDFIYQRPTEQIVFFADQYIFMLDFPSLKLVSGYPKHISILGGRSSMIINGVVNSYKGNTFIFFNTNYYMLLDECNFQIKSYGLISDTFSFLPGNMESVFRFTDGLLYFFKNNTILGYSEFLNTVVKAQVNELDVFGVECSKYSNNANILNKLKSLVLQLK